MFRPLTPVPRSLPSLVFLSLLSNSSVVAAVADCYYPDGGIALQVAPCSEDGGACCPYQWQCLSNGLCSNTAAEIMGRYSCTDQTWQSEKCPQTCTHENTATGNEAILQCADGSYCCDGNRSWDCCTTNSTLFFDLPAGNYLTSVTATYAPTSYKTVTNTPAPASEVRPRISDSETTHTTTSPTTVVSTDTISRSTSSSGPSSDSISGSSAPTSTVTSRTTSTNANGGVKTNALTSTAYANPSSSSNSQSATNSHHSKDNSTLILGLALGIPLALLVIIGSAIGLYCFRRRRHQRRSNNDPFSTGTTSSSFFSFNSSRRSNHSSTGMLQSANYVNLANGTHAPELDGLPVGIHSVDEKRELVGSDPMEPQLLDTRETSPAVEAGGQPIPELDGSGSGGGFGLFGAQRQRPMQHSQQQQSSRKWLNQYIPWRSNNSTTTTTPNGLSPVSSSGAPSPISPAVQSAFHENFSAESLSPSQPHQVQQEPSPVSSTPTMIRMPPPRYSFYGGVVGRRMPGIAEEEGEVDGAAGLGQHQQQPAEMWGGDVKRSQRPRSQGQSQSQSQSQAQWNDGRSKSNRAPGGGRRSSTTWRVTNASIAEADEDEDDYDDIGGEGVVPREGV